MRMAIASDHDRSALGDPDIALTQDNAFALGQADELLDRAVHEPGVGRMSDRLGLHGGIHDHALEVHGRKRARLVRNRKALLQQRFELLLAHALAPARQGRAIERRLVPEEFLATKILVIGVLHPAFAQHLVGEIVRVL